MELPLHPNACVLARHPAGLVALDKPPGVRSHPNSAEPDHRALLHLPYEAESEAYRMDDGSGEAVFLLHRLDAPTSGVVLMATDSAVATAVRDAFARHTVRKTYYALVRGLPARREETWRDRLRVRRERGTLRADVGAGDLAETRIECLVTFSGPPVLSLLRLRPVTGRTHQLRVQCAARRLPIVGDATYGDFRFNRNYARQTGEKRLFLHAAALHLEGDRMCLPAFEVQSPIPSAFPAF
ncbi:MAG: RNA pseudouridine synthase [Opitutales bacterium]|nr:RNA pseudouridine synthase [Opitutales bacterium]